MKAITTKESVSLAVIVIVAPVLALGVVIAARVMVATGNEFMLLALTLCGAVVSGINGFGRRTVKAESQSRRSRGGPQSSVALLP
jgi:FtsH-binding integral membrane protein